MSDIRFNPGNVPETTTTAEFQELMRYLRETPGALIELGTWQIHQNEDGTIDRLYTPPHKAGAGTP